MISKIRILLLILSFVIFKSGFSNPVGLKKATLIASNFYASKIARKSVTADASAIKSYLVKSNDKFLFYYIFNFQDDGFVIVSADDSFYPVLAYSPKGSVDRLDFPSNVAGWMNWYEGQMIEGLRNHSLCFGEPAKEWAQLLTVVNSETKNTRDEGVQPLTTSTWSQLDFYNEMCPADVEGFAGHAPVGCVATAMAQIMYYFRFPEQGNGSHAYTPSYNNGEYGIQHADFENTTYQWDGMVDACFESNAAVAELCYHCGVSVNMDYQPTSAGSDTEDVPLALKEYFNYAPSAEYFNRQSFGTFEEWQSLLIQNLNNRQPMLYRSTGGWSGHAYVCDGYQDSTHFHFNWGWNGNYNGYFYINQLIPGGINLTPGQGAVVNIYPDTTSFQYPEYCQDSKTLTYNSGTFEDGSGPGNYKASSNCAWLIKPENPEITNITLEFIRLETEEGSDLISVYDGETQTAPLIGTFSGSTIPAKIFSSGPALFLTFTTNEFIENQGWLASFYGFTLPFCNGIFVAGGAEGEIEDGSKILDYSNNTDCEWLIDPVIPATDSIGRIHLNFHRFDVAPGDTLFIFDGASSNAPLLGKYSGTNLPPDVESSSDKVFLNFKTNQDTVAAGWDIIYWPIAPVYCHDTTWFYEANGTIEDGSVGKNYLENTECFWGIHVEGAKNITLEFVKVEMEENYDNLKIFDFYNPGPYLARITGNEIPEPVVVNSNKVLLKFTTDFADNFDGWKLNYTSTPSGIDQQNFLSKIEVKPNPTKDFIRICCPDATESGAAFLLSGINGMVVQRGVLMPGCTPIDLTMFPSGIYLLRLQSGTGFLVKKIVKF